MTAAERRLCVMATLQAVAEAFDEIKVNEKFWMDCGAKPGPMDDREILTLALRAIDLTTAERTDVWEGTEEFKAAEAKEARYINRKWRVLDFMRRGVGQDRNTVGFHPETTKANAK